MILHKGTAHRRAARRSGPAARHRHGAGRPQALPLAQRRGEPPDRRPGPPRRRAAGRWMKSTPSSRSCKERRHSPGTALSGGQQQMVAIGRALMSNPELLLCDEISLGLAPVVIRDIYAALPRDPRHRGRRGHRRTGHRPRAVGRRPGLLHDGGPRHPDGPGQGRQPRGDPCRLFRGGRMTPACSFCPNILWGFGGRRAPNVRAVARPSRAKARQKACAAALHFHNRRQPRAPA